LLHEIMACK